MTTLMTPSARGSQCMVLQRLSCSIDSGMVEGFFGVLFIPYGFVSFFSFLVGSGGSTGFAPRFINPGGPRLKSTLSEGCFFSSFLCLCYLPHIPDSGDQFGNPLRSTTYDLCQRHSCRLGHLIPGLYHLRTIFPGHYAIYTQSRVDLLQLVRLTLRHCRLDSTRLQRNGSKEGTIALLVLPQGIPPFKYQDMQGKI